MAYYVSDVLPHKKRRKVVTSSFSLPDAVAISCFALVSRFDHAALSLVSKSFRSMLVSDDLYQTRSSMGYTEKFLYVCLCEPPNLTPRWFIIRPSLDSATGKEVNLARPIPSFPCQPRKGSSVLALDWGIYVIGGWVNGMPTSGVLLLDCRSHKWRHVTSMRVARVFAEACVVDGKIQVLGGCEDKNDLGEVFDPKTQSWTDVKVLKVEEKKVYVVDSWNRSFYHLQRQSIQGSKPRNSVYSKDWCVVDKLIYSCGVDGGIYWCEPNDLDQCEAVGRYWRKVNGLQNLYKMLRDSRAVHFGCKMVKMWESYKMMYNINKNLEELLPENKLTNLGQNVLVFGEWLGGVFGQERLEILCVEICLERLSGNEILGRTVWLERILVIDLCTVDPLLYNSKILYHTHVDV
ncbi:putative F-box/kelch-repeat protein At3g24610 [Capsella rubella]|uniref:putative F-box/kelch-repeat protein At3g24610 n=1 Tax=Capsella rubella TaxID=81985 RepID=UPI000CD54429|nr:putative F-box/kelch-repeat protein At3g24610 [Capsella rubella]